MNVRGNLKLHSNKPIMEASTTSLMNPIILDKSFHSLSLNECHPKLQANEPITDASTIALKNPIILEKIFHLLSLNEVCEFRLVNRYWYSAATVPLRGKTGWVNLLTRASIKEFLQFWTRGKTLPFSRYVVYLYDYQRSTKVLEAFWERVADTMSELELRGDLLLPDIKNLITLKSDGDAIQFSSLKSLKLHTFKYPYKNFLANVDPNDTKTGEVIRWLLFSVLEHSPNLNSLEIILEGDHIFLQKVMDLFIDTMDKRNGKQKLKLLRIDTNIFEDSHFRRLANTGLKLSVFSLSILKPRQWDREFNQIIRDSDGSGISDFLQSQCETLETLQIPPLPVFLKKFDLPTMKQLQSMRVFSVDCRHVGFSNAISIFNFSGKVPALKKLRLSWREPQRPVIFPIALAHAASGTLEELILDYYDERNNDGSSSFNCLKNLRILEFHTGRCNTMEIYRKLPNLEKLTINSRHFNREIKCAAFDRVMVNWSFSDF